MQRCWYKKFLHDDGRNWRWFRGLTLIYSLPHLIDMCIISLIALKGRGEISHCQGWRDWLSHCHWNCSVNIKYEHFPLMLSQVRMRRRSGSPWFLYMILFPSGDWNLWDAVKCLIEDIKPCSSCEEVQHYIPATKKSAAQRQGNLCTHPRNSRTLPS